MHGTQEIRLDSVTELDDRLALLGWLRGERGPSGASTSCPSPRGERVRCREQDKKYPNVIRYYAGTQTITEMPEVCKAVGLPDDS
ncbi:hypothetical protein [Streptomyces sp. NPDC054874]